MKRLSNLFRSDSQKQYTVHKTTPSTDDLAAGFGERFVFSTATKNGKTLSQVSSRSLDNLSLDVSETGISIVDREEKTVLSWDLVKINMFEAVGQDSGSPTFQFTHFNGESFDMYSFGTMQADQLFVSFNKSIQKARKSLKSEE